MPQNISSLVVYYNRRCSSRRASPAQGRLDLDRDGQRGQGLDQGRRRGRQAGPPRPRRRPGDHPARPVRVVQRAASWSISTRSSLPLLPDPAARLRHVALPDLHRVDKVVPSQAEVEGRGPRGPLPERSARHGYVIAPVHPDLPADQEVRLGHRPLPQHDQPASVLHSDAYCMTSASGNKEAAWRFMEFALGPDGQRITAETGRTVPSLIEVSTSTRSSTPGPAGQLQGVPRHHPGDPAVAERLHLAGDRRRRQHHPGAGVLQ